MKESARDYIQTRDTRKLEQAGARERNKGTGEHGKNDGLNQTRRILLNGKY